MKWVKRIGGALAAIAFVLFVVGWWLLNDRPSLAQYDSMHAAPATPGAVSVRFLGVATILIDDGETALLTDGFFSRPGALQLLFGEVEPDQEAIARGLRRAGITKLAAVIVNHSHYDHAMDAPEVAKRTGALLVGSESTANVGRGLGLDEAQIRVPKVGEPMHYGRFVVTLLPSRHAPTDFTGGEITQPLRPPVPAKAYLEGRSFAVLVEHAGKSLLINASAGFEPAALRAVKADVVLLGVGSLDRRPQEYREHYWREVVAAVGAKRVIPIHWDDFTQSAGTPPTPWPAVIGDFDQTMAFLKGQGAKYGVDVRMPLNGGPMDVWVGLVSQ